MKKIFLALLTLIIFVGVVYGAVYRNTINSGLWYIYGTGYIEKSNIRFNLRLQGDMNLKIQPVKELGEEITELLDGEETVSRALTNQNARALTSYEISLNLDITGAGIDIWERHIDNGIKIPVLLPTSYPTDKLPFTLPEITYDNITYTLSFNSENSGTLKMRGYPYVDNVGTCEIKAECVVWKSGTERPEIDKGVNSGCNFGIDWKIIVLALMILGGLKFVRN